MHIVIAGGPLFHPLKPRGTLIELLMKLRMARSVDVMKRHPSRRNVIANRMNGTIRLMAPQMHDRSRKEFITRCVVRMLVCGPENSRESFTMKTAARLNRVLATETFSSCVVIHPQFLFVFRELTDSARASVK